jgi:hypothetical protein
MTREAVTVPAHPRGAPWRGVQRTLRFAVLAFLLWSTAGAPALVHAQWLGLPDPPDPPDEVDCVACPAEAEEPAPTPPTPSTTPTSERPRAPRPRHEFTVGTAFALTSVIARRSTVDGAQYRIALSRREAVLQSSWTVFGPRAVGLRLALGVGAGKPVLKFEEPFLDAGWFGPEPVRLPGVAVSLDASVGLVVRAGPVRVGPQVIFNHTWLRDAAGYTVNEDVPYTTPSRLRAGGLGVLLGAHPHPRVLLTLETRVYMEHGLVGGSLRLSLGASWPAGATGRPRRR